MALIVSRKLFIDSPGIQRLQAAAQKLILRTKTSREEPGPCPPCLAMLALSVFVYKLLISYLQGITVSHQTQALWFTPSL